MPKATMITSLHTNISEIQANAICLRDLSYGLISNNSLGQRIQKIIKLLLKEVFYLVQVAEIHDKLQHVCTSKAKITDIECLWTINKIRLITSLLNVSKYSSIHKHLYQKFREALTKNDMVATQNLMVGHLIDINAPDCLKILGEACRNKRKSIVKLFVSAGVDISVLHTLNLNPTDLQLLLDAGLFIQNPLTNIQLNDLCFERYDLSFVLFFYGFRDSEVLRTLNENKEFQNANAENFLDPIEIDNIQQPYIAQKLDISFQDTSKILGSRIVSIIKEYFCQNFTQVYLNSSDRVLLRDYTVDAIILNRKLIIDYKKLNVNSNDNIVTSNSIQLDQFISEKKKKKMRLQFIWEFIQKSALDLKKENRRLEIEEENTRDYIVS